MAYFAFANRSGVAVTETPSGTLPEAGGVTASTSEETPGTITETGQPAKVSARLVEITKDQVAPGEVAFATSTAASPSDIAINFVARQSGNVYQYLEGAGTLSRISNKTIPGIEEAKWLPSGALAFVRYLSGDTHSTINTYALAANGQGGYFLAQNIADLAVSPSNLLALASGVNGSVAMLERPDGSGSKQAFTTPLSELRIAFGGSAGLVAFTKPSAALPGYAYFVNASGLFEKVAGPYTGLVALPSPSGKRLLLSYVSGGILKMSLLDTTTRELIPLPLGTIADKCVWSADSAALYCGIPTDPPTAAAYPDDWYQGAVAFSDRIWKIDVEGRFAELTLDFNKETGQDLDATGLAIDPKSQVLVFRNKNDGSLWSYAL